MSDSTLASCRAALLKACHYRWTSLPGNEGAERLVVDVDDAAACMAEREARLIDALDLLLNRYRHNMLDSRPCASCATARAALAAAQGGTDE